MICSSNGTACRNANGAWVPASTNGAVQPASAPHTSTPAVPQDTVFQVQQKLHDLGFYVTSNIDGRWGPKTAIALQNFQRANRLNPTGQLDDSTMNALGIKSQ